MEKASEHQALPFTAATDNRDMATRLGAIAWFISAVQFMVVQVIVASVWSPAYSWTMNYISDLGNTACGQFSVPHGTASDVCSPRHDLMNLSFIAAGLLTIADALLLRPLLTSRKLSTWAFTLWVICGLGKIVVGLVPENSNVGPHVLGALNVPIGSVAVLLTTSSLCVASGHLRCLDT